jgi:hypothetical protein
MGDNGADLGDRNEKALPLAGGLFRKARGLAGGDRFACRTATYGFL